MLAQQGMSLLDALLALCIASVGISAMSVVMRQDARILQWQHSRAEDDKIQNFICTPKQPPQFTCTSSQKSSYANTTYIFK